MAATTTLKKKKKKSYHHGHLRSALIEGAIELIAERGRAEFTLRELARRLGVTHAATYHHFRDKDALLAAVAEEGYRAMGAHLEALSQEASDDPIEKMRAMGVGYVRFALENQAHFRVMFGHKFADISAYPSMKEVGEATKSLMMTLVSQGQQEGLYKDCPLDELIATCWATVHGLALLTINGHFDDQLEESDDLDAFVQTITQHAFLGTAGPAVREALAAQAGEA